MSEKIVQFNEEIIKGQIKELVRGSVEETLNELLEQEAEKLTQAARYERNEARQGYRSGHYDRNLTTTSGDVTLHVPRLKGISFETAIIERYRRRESSVEEALIEMYLAGVSVRRVEDITEALWGSKVSPAMISELNKKAYALDCGQPPSGHIPCPCPRLAWLPGLPCAVQLPVGKRPVSVRLWRLCYAVNGLLCCGSIPVWVWAFRRLLRRFVRLG